MAKIASSELEGAPAAGRARTRTRAKTPTLLQMEATECGAASLGILLAHYGRWVPLETLREDCGVSRDGSNASNILRAARAHGMIAKGYKKSVDNLAALPMPAIIHWNFNHFLVVEGFGTRGLGLGQKKTKIVYLNDPAYGRRQVTREVFGESFTGVVLSIEPGPEMKKTGRPPSPLRSLKERIAGSEGALLFLFLAALMLVIPGLVLPTLSRMFVDDILLAGKQDWLRPLLVGMLLTAVVRGSLTWLKQTYFLRLSTKLSVTTSARLFWHILRLPIPFFLSRYAGDVGDRIKLNDKVARVLSGRLSTTALDLLMVLFYGVLLLAYDVTLTLLGITLAAINLVVFRLVARTRRDANLRLQQEAGKLAGVSMGGLQVIETLKASGLESDFFAHWAGYWAKFQNSFQELGKTNLFVAATPAFVTALNHAAILTLGGVRVIEGEMTVGMLVAFQTLMASFLQPVDSLVSLGSVLQETEADLRRLDDILRCKPAARIESLEIPHVGDGESKQEPAPAAYGKLSGAIEIDELTFGYAPQAPPLVDGFTLKVEPGYRVALVGGSGSGKSTIARIVAGVYEPWSGTIRFDGEPRAKIPLARLHDSVAMVDQDIFLFEGTIRDNLTMWDPSIPDADLIRAAQDAHIHDDIAARPGGYDAWVEEGGRNFSGGQRQRLEIARALARNPTILLLDEATSALDPRTEKIIDDNLRRRGCTCLIVAHRLSTIRDADEIIVVDEGRVVERGTHARLIELKGRYDDLMGAA